MIRWSFIPSASSIAAQAQKKGAQCYTCLFIFALIDPFQLRGVTQTLSAELRAGHIARLVAHRRELKDHASALDDPIVPTILDALSHLLHDPMVHRRWNSLCFFLRTVHVFALEFWTCRA